MNSILIIAASATVFAAGYLLYGRFLARRIFRLDPQASVPSRELKDNVDFVPTHRQVIFGHHFTSIAGTGPIVGPAIAVFWGWLPALLWILVGSVFIGAVHDFGALVVSLRSRGQSIGDVAGRMISKRARILFLSILFFALTVVIAIFGLVIAVIFAKYPESVLSVWTAMPLAVMVGLWIHKKGGRLLGPSLIALFTLYLSIVLGVYFLPLDLTKLFGIPLFGGAGTAFFPGLKSAVVIWTGLLLVYCFFASVLPVWLLLQPRDYINSHQLFVALALLIAGIAAAHPAMTAPAVNLSPPADAPPLMPFIFIIIACGAVSGFHCLVSSGTTSKQLAKETDAQYVGYGAMLLEAALAVIVIVACCAGLGLSGGGANGSSAWVKYYGADWKSMTLSATIGAFVDGGANFLSVIGIPLRLSVGIIAVMVACFAATTLDTATRLHRYVIQELASVSGIQPLRNKYLATLLAVLVGGALAMIPGPMGPGSGGLILWPLFGAVNQLLAGLAFLVVAFYLLRHSRPVVYVLIPAVLMVVFPAWVMTLEIIRWSAQGNWLLVCVGTAVEVLQLWMVAEGVLLWRKCRGVAPTPLPPLSPVPESR